LFRLGGLLTLLAIDFDERAEIVEVRRLAAGERGAGRIDERDGELGESGNACDCVSHDELSVGRDCCGEPSRVEFSRGSTAADPTVERCNDASVGVVGESIFMTGDVV